MSANLRRLRSVNATTLVEQAEVRRSATLAALDPKEQARLGQYFTPAKAAELLADMVALPAEGIFRVLDPGAGSGSLSAALVARILDEAPNLTIDLVAVELDESLVGPLIETLAECQHAAEAAGVKMTWTVVKRDYIEASIGLDRDARLSMFDLALMNPPYGKMAAGDSARRCMAGQIVDTPNLYAAFMALGISQLRKCGQLVAITPRSFANGPYFAPFRLHLLSQISLTHIHDFASRSTVFADTKVLQETIVIAGSKGIESGEVLLTTSVGHEDEPLSRTVHAIDVVSPVDPQRFIRIPTEDLNVAKVIALRDDLAATGISVSTGRVVDFRSRENLLRQADENSAPMVYPTNFRDGVIEWPLKKAKAQHYAVRNPQDAKQLMPAGSYVVVKRFSAKEERRRVVAAVWTSDVPVAFDNKTNVFHTSKHGMDLKVARGLCIWLNSTPIDDFFRTFSGHTQVNATDLRIMRYPTEKTLRLLGSSWQAPLVQEQADAIVEKYVFGG